MVSTRDNFFYHEMMTHPVLFMHPDPRRVAIIGGGDCGTLHEVLKHPEVQQATQIDIDRVVTEASEIHFPELCASNGDPRARLLYADGIQWITDAAPGSLDVIIVDSTDPVGPGEVLFTPDFHAACRRALGAQGLLVQQSESPLIHMAILERLHRSLKGAGFAAARTLFFPQPIYPTGWWSATIGIRDADGGEFRAADARAATFATRYYNADIHQAAFAEPQFFRRARRDWWHATPAA
jgi:spermidine synthase